MENVKALLSDYLKVQEGFKKEEKKIVDRLAEYFRENHIQALEILDDGWEFRDNDDTEYVITHIVLHENELYAAHFPKYGDNDTPDETTVLQETGTVEHILRCIIQNFTRPVDNPEEIIRLAYLAEHGVPMPENAIA
ncbi:MAG: hypothetical protein HPY53_01485 [Brevinematales bacterium]|nr:hypothetical protein [Brevinematales bacterium]